MTKPKQLEVIAQVPCEGDCGATVPVQRCTGGRKVRIACGPCDIQKFMGMAAFERKYGLKEEEDEREDEKPDTTGTEDSDAGTGNQNPDRKPATSSFGYF